MDNSVSNEPQYWLLVGSPENYQVSQDLGFTVQGIKARYRKKAELIQHGDKILYYLTGKMVIAGVVTVCSEMFEDSTPVWPCSNPNERYPWRVHIEPDLIPADESQYLSVKPLAGELEYLRKWPEKNWTLGFQGNLHQWPASDYLRVRGLLEKSVKSTAIVC